MSDFSEVISIAGKEYHFKFRAISIPSGLKYFVSTPGDFISFEIEINYAIKLLEPVPEFIKEMQSALFAIIEKKVSNC